MTPGPGAGGGRENWTQREEGTGWGHRGHNVSTSSFGGSRGGQHRLSCVDTTGTRQGLSQRNAEATEAAPGGPEGASGLGGTPGATPRSPPLSALLTGEGQGQGPRSEAGLPGPNQAEQRRRLIAEGQSAPRAHLTDSTARQRRSAEREAVNRKGAEFQGTNPEPVGDSIPIVRPDLGRALSQNGNTLRANGCAASNEWHPR